jgi:hypothetical protein
VLVISIIFQQFKVGLQVKKERRFLQESLENHLQRMRQYLAHSFHRCRQILPVTNWQAMSMDQHEMLAAFRVRFSEFQEHLGKTMRAVAIEEVWI